MVVSPNEKYSDIKQPKALDLSHHYADAVKELKSAHEPNKFQGRPGLVNLDGGVPATDYYPIESITVEYLRPDAYPLSPSDTVPSSTHIFGWLASLFTGKKASTKSFTIPRYFEDPTATKGAKFELKSALTYSPVQGLKPLEEWIREWSGIAQRPAISDWDTLVTVGATASWGLVIKALVNPGEGILADAYSYNFAVSQGIGSLARFVSVAIDEDGTSADDLERILSGWDEETRGYPRPRVFYTQGGISNPTGQLIPSSRKQAIYDLCVKYDIIIVEDDPYRWQEASLPYFPPGEVNERERMESVARGKTDEEWLRGVSESFLRFDVEGRVIRIDTFSKTVGPGVRLGYFTSSPSLLRILRFITEETNQAPSGLSQAIVGQLLHTFEQGGFTRWLRGLGAQYELRRNWAIDTLFEHLHFEKSGSAFVAYKKPDATRGMVTKAELGKSLFSFVPPVGGMFIWFSIHLHHHPLFPHLSHTTSESHAKTVLADRVWNELGEAGVLLRPGELFAIGTPEERVERGEHVVFLRASYSSNSREVLEKGFTTFAEVLVKFFE